MFAYKWLHFSAKVAAIWYVEKKNFNVGTFFGVTPIQFLSLVLSFWSCFLKNVIEIGSDLNRANIHNFI